MMMHASMLLSVIEGAPVAPADAWNHWGGDPGALVSILVLAFLYGIGVRRLWHNAGRYHVVSRFEVIAFYAGIFTLLAALCSPLDALADTLFSAHMMQHVLLITVAAPLAILGAPLLPMLWSLPRSMRVGAGRSWNAVGMRTAGAALVLPLPAWALHTLALWVWHTPGLYSAALTNDAIHACEHASFYLTALLVWWVALRPLRGHGGVAGAVCVLVGTLAQSGALGAILTFSATPWYYGQSAGAAAWGLTPLQDQQLAGLIMWIPAGFAYLAGVLAVMRRILMPSVSRAGVVASAALVTATTITACSRTPAERQVADGSPRLGKVAIQHYGCGSCHAIPGIRSADGIVGPSLAGIADRRMIAGIVPNTPDEMVRWIVMPQSMAPGNAMPNLGVSDGQARDIAAYLYTLH
ncbi:MAG TPA: cytochrome c oxidase assembly protein [Gemmatimonadaceae bacterium]|jgi:cytochrome c oxidase assembly factor CtaG